MPLTSERLAEIAAHLATRPGHEAVRVDVSLLLVEGLGARPGDVLFEQPVKEVRGRVDALVGRTVFEFKSNLRRERADAEEQLTRYLSEREAATRERYVGVATDGATFIVYDLQDSALTQLQEFRPEPENAHGLLLRLSSVVVAAEEIAPEPDLVRAQLGRGSVAWMRARNDMSLYWTAVSTQYEAEYLTAILNSETARTRTAPLQSRGQWGARHFAKSMLTLPIPRFDAQDALHLELAAEAARAEEVAAAVKLKEGMHFVKARREVRTALAVDGVAGRIDGLVAQLLG